MQNRRENANLQSAWTTSDGTSAGDPTPPDAVNAAHTHDYRDQERYWIELGLEHRLRELESKYHSLWNSYCELEEKYADATKLIVAASRLHYAGSQANLIQVVFEIAANILGCEEVAIFRADSALECLFLVASSGIDAAAWPHIRYGEGVIGQSVLTREVYLAGHEGSTTALSKEANVSACIPLRANDRVIGAIVTFRLLPQRAGLNEKERELIEFLGRHAGLALYATGLHERFVAQTGPYDARGDTT